jgi:glutamyl-tRNA synthetase
VHVMLWEYLGWKEKMPEWAHLPLILKPDGQGKLSKRDGDRLGFPVFAMDWQDPKSGELAKGFKEMGFLPEAFVNMLAMLGWNDGSGDEIFTLTELAERFSMERIQKAGAKFDFEKAKWFNQEWIKKATVETLLPLVSAKLQENGIEAEVERLGKIIPMVKERCQLLNDFVQQSAYFFQDPPKPDLELIKPKWDSNKAAFFEGWLEKLQANYSDNPAALETEFKEMASAAQLKVGELQLPLRIMLVGGKFGPPVFEIITLIGMEATRRRVNKALSGLA